MEIREHEPRDALDGGEDGLWAIRGVVPVLGRALRPAGLAALEIGWDQGDAVCGLAQAAGLLGVRLRRDHAGLARVVVARR